MELISSAIKNLPLFLQQRCCGLYGKIPPPLKRSDLSKISSINMTSIRMNRSNSLQEHLQLFLQGPMEHKGFQWLGLNHVLGKAAKIRSDLRDYLAPLLTQTTCLSCQGSRLNNLARHVKIENLSVADFCKLPIQEAGEFMKKLSVPAFLEEAHRQLQHRLHFLVAIGLGSISGTVSPTLSGGETQRIRLSRQLGSGLTGCLYVLDEPTIGLHPLDNELLNQALLDLRDMGNTLLLVEHVL